MNGLRRYECEYYSLSADPRSCFFCVHCTDIYFDYSNGPYMSMCDLDCDVDLGLAGSCDSFVDEEDA